MKYTITYSCGHNGTVNLFGPGKERERKIYWYENNGECPDCRQARLQAENQKAAEESGAHNWPELEGTEKQIAWATTIRLDLYKEKASRDLGEYRELFETCVDETMSEHTQAGWWIGNRNTSAFAQEVIDRMNARRAGNV